MNTDTGEKLDIVYTTDSTTPRDGHMSEVIAEQQNELPCYDTAANNQAGYFYSTICIIFIVGAGKWIYLWPTFANFKKWHNLFVKLLMLYSFSILGTNTASCTFLLLLNSFNYHSITGHMPHHCSSSSDFLYVYSTICHLCPHPDCM